MTSIDLVPPEAIRRRETRQRLRRWGTRLGTGFVVAVVVHVGLVQLAAGQRDELDRLTRKYSQLQEQLERAEGLLEQREELGRHREAISLIRADDTSGHYLDLLGGTLPPQSYLTTLALERCPPFEREARDRRDPQECQARLRLQGNAPGHEAVGQIIRGLVGRDEFKSVSLVSVSDPLHGTAGKDEVTFEILCVLADVRRGGR